MSAPVKRQPLVIGAIAAFAIGIGVGYLIRPVSYASEAARDTVAGAVAHSEDPSNGEAGMARVRRSTRTLEVPVPVRMDAEGNFILPPAMAERLQCIFLNGTKVNAKDLKITGLDDEQIGEIQKLLDEVFQRIAERQRAGMSEFTISDQEMVWKIRGDRSAAEADKQWLTDRLQQICGAKAGLISERLINEVGNSNVRFCETDYYLRVYHYRPEHADHYLGFENIVLHPERSKESGRPTEPLEPGVSFTDYDKRWIYESSNRTSGLVPPDTLIPLLHDKDWQRLLKPGK